MSLDVTIGSADLGQAFVQTQIDQRQNGSVHPASSGRRFTAAPGSVLVPVSDVYFFVDAVAALTFHEGRSSFHAGFAGPGDALGLHRLFDVKLPYLTARILRVGTVIAVPLARLHAIAGDDRGLHGRFMRLALSRSGRFIEEAAVAMTLPLEKRVGRWILQCQRMLGDPYLPITHHQLADALGVRRSSVTVALHVLEGERFIRARRARIELLDAGRLAAFCESEGPGCQKS